MGKRETGWAYGPDRISQASEQSGEGVACGRATGHASGGIAVDRPDIVSPSVDAMKTLKQEIDAWRSVEAETLAVGDI
jgi:hypothetical protein